ncbi:MAG: glycosyl transferase, partial [Bacteroidetes bacterium]
MLPKILIIRFSSIGDIVLTTPVIRALKQQFNNGNNLVHYVTKKPFAGIIAANPYVDKVYGIEKSTSEIIEQLQNEDYDYIVDLHKNIRSYR